MRSFKRMLDLAVKIASAGRLAYHAWNWISDSL